MSTSSLIGNPKKLKLNAEQDTDSGSRSLDNFPDVLLQHILSFLPTKYSVRMSVLSRRWRYLWTSLPNLDFQEGEGLPTKRQHFMNFVERVLLLHDISCTKRFSLSCNVQGDASRINAWISAAIWRNAQELDICLSGIKDTWVLPYCLFKCDKLEMLKLDMHCVLKLPSQISLSSLKILILKNCIFLDDLSTQLLFLSPALEKLVLDECNWVNLPNLIISAPGLWSLTIREMDEKSCSYSDSEHHYSNGGGCQVMIHGTGLRDFYYSGKLASDYRLCTTSTIVNASLDVPTCCKNSSEAADTVYKLLKGLSDVKNLKVSIKAVQVLTDATELLTALPIFDNLISLALGPEQVDLSCTALHAILQNCPCVETLILTEGISQSYKFDWLTSALLTSFLSHLKSIVVREFKGNDEELVVMQILLEKAIVLDTLVIYFASGPVERKEAEFLLSILPRGSKSSKLIFI